VVKAGLVHLCRMSGNTMLSHMAGDALQSSEMVRHKTISFLHKYNKNRPATKHKCNY